MNPTSKFYTLLLKLFSAQVFDHELAHQAIDIYEDHKAKITLPDVTMDSLELWHEQILHGDAESDSGDKKAEEISMRCFQDIAGNMGNREVRKLHKEWKDRAGIPDDIFVQIRSKKDLGENTSAGHYVTDDDEEFERALQNLSIFVLRGGKIRFFPGTTAQGQN